MPLTEKTTEVLNLLRKNVEGEVRLGNGETWGTVYLDNARPGDLTGHQFAGRLAALEKAGLYVPVDGEFWGAVKPA